MLMTSAVSEAAEAGGGLLLLSEVSATVVLTKTVGNCPTLKKSPLTTVRPTESCWERPGSKIIPSGSMLIGLLKYIWFVSFGKISIAIYTYNCCYLHFPGFAHSPLLVNESPEIGT
jgi:hypothetical protein